MMRRLARVIAMGVCLGCEEREPVSIPSLTTMPPFEARATLSREECVAQQKQGELGCPWILTTETGERFPMCNFDGSNRPCCVSGEIREEPEESSCSKVWR